MNRILNDNISLNEAKMHKSCVVQAVEADESEKLRLYDLGFMPSSSVVPMYASFLNSTKAYLVKGTLIALRSDCSRHIRVSQETEVHEI